MRKLTLRGEDGAEKPFIAISTFCAAGWHPKLFRKGASWLFRIRTSYFPVNRTYTGLFARTARDVLPVATTQKAHNTSYERWEFTKKKRFKDKDFSKIIGDGKFAILLAKYIQATGRSEQVEIWRDTKEGSNFP